MHWTSAHCLGNGGHGGNDGVVLCLCISLDLTLVLYIYISNPHMHTPWQISGFSLHGYVLKGILFLFELGTNKEFESHVNV